MIQACENVIMSLDAVGRRRRSAFAAIKVLALTVQVILSGIICYLLYIGFLSSFIPDGSNHNHGGMIAGLLSLFISAIPVAPLLVATVTKRIGWWWAAVHGVLVTASFGLIVCAALYETS